MLDTETHSIKTVQHDAYYKCIYNAIHKPSFKNKLFVKDDILFKIIQDADKSFKALIVYQSFTLTIPVNSYNLQGQIDINKASFLTKKTSLENSVHKHW